MNTILDTIVDIAQILTLFAVIIYVYKTWHIASATKESAKATEKSADISRQTLDEMKESRDQETAPYVVAFFDVSPNKPLIYLVVKNVGRSLAENVKLEFDPQIENTRKEMNDMPFIKDGIGSMPPGYEIRTFFDTAISYFSENNNLPLAYKVKISYSYSSGIVSKPKTIEQILDLSAIEGLIFIVGKDMDDLVKNIDKLTQNTHYIEKNLESISNRIADGIWIMNPEILTTNFKIDITNWKLMAFAKLEEFKTLWVSLYGGERNKLIDPFLHDLQTKLTTIGSQILVICSKGLPNVSTDLIDKLVGIAIKLSEFGRIRFRADGGRSLDNFDKLGNEIISLINEIATDKPKTE